MVLGGLPIGTFTEILENLREARGIIYQAFVVFIGVPNY
jgi:hypothetical protein